MLKKIFSRMILMLILVNLNTLVFSIKIAKAEPKIIRVPLDQPTIQAAINVASAGDTIYVYSGIYDGFTVWDYKPHLLIEGENPVATFVYGSITIEADNTTITGFTIQSSTVEVQYSNGSVIRGNRITKSGVYLHYTIGNTVEDNIIFENASITLYSSSRNTISGNWIYDNYFCGIDLDYSFYNVISRNDIANNNWYGVHLDHSSYNGIFGNNIANNGHGILLYHSLNNSISVNNITANNYGIYLSSSLNNNIYGNNIANNNNVGINLWYSSNNSISGNNITANNYGIYLSSSSNNILRNNSMVGNRQNFELWGQESSDFINDVDASNTVDGKLIYYWINTQDIMVPHDAGCIILVNSTNITIKELELKNNGDGVLLAYTTNTTITQNNITNNHYGIRLYHSSNNSITRNNITANEVYGIELYFSSKNSICGNMFTHNGLVVFESYCNVVKDNLVNGKPLIYLEEASDLRVVDAGQVVLVKCSSIILESLNLAYTDIAIELWMTNNTRITNNNIANNKYTGIHLCYSSNNSISGNNITANNQPGIHSSFSSHNSIYGNNIANNSDGIDLWYSSYNIISGNNITANNVCGIDLLESYNNSIYHNNFIANAKQAYIQPAAATYANIWDDGYPSGGNYWSDYGGEDANGDGIGDIPYVIDADNMDRYPLMSPWEQGVTSYSLTVVTTTGGTTNPAPGTYTYTVGTEVNVTAIPDVGYSFDYWLLNGEMRTENPITIIMYSNHTLEAHFVDDIPPEISQPIQQPEEVQPQEEVRVWVNVTDFGTGVKTVTLWYSLDNGTTWTVVNMTAYREIYEALWGGTIPGCEYCTWVTYKIIAYDNTGNNATKDNLGYYYKYHIIPEFPSTMVLPLLMSLTLLNAAIAKKRRLRKTTK